MPCFDSFDLAQGSQGHWARVFDFDFLMKRSLVVLCIYEIWLNLLSTLGTYTIKIAELSRFKLNDSNLIGHKETSKGFSGRLDREFE